jgi:hypothetical protein
MQLPVVIKTIFHVIEMASILSCGGDMIMFIGLYLGPSLTVFKEVTLCKPTGAPVVSSAVTLKRGQVCLRLHNRNL